MTGRAMESNFANRIELKVSRWAAWAPGLEAPDEWAGWAAGRKDLAPQGTPDVQFVAPMMRRRLSLPSRMAFRVAADCMAGEPETEDGPVHVFCSRYGEYERTFGILNDLAAGEPASALAFSTSVHNTAASLYAIDREDRAVSTSLAAGRATLEAAFVEAWGLLASGEASSVLLVYADAPLPDVYPDEESSIRHPVAIAFLLKSADAEGDGCQLSLAWRERAETDRPDPLEDPALSVLRLVLSSVAQVIADDGRLIWEWRKGHADA